MTPPTHAQIVTFRLGDDLFAADIHAVERVLRYRAPAPVPNVPAWIEGVIEYQGRVVPVVNLRRRFEMSAAAPAHDARILVFDADGERVAGAVDAVLDVSSVDPAAIAAPPPLCRGLSREYLRGIVRRGDSLVVIVDAARILSATERLVVRDAADAAEPAAAEAAGA